MKVWYPILLGRGTLSSVQYTVCTYTVYVPVCVSAPIRVSIHIPGIPIVRCATSTFRSLTIFTCRFVYTFIRSHTITQFSKYPFGEKITKFKKTRLLINFIPFGIQFYFFLSKIVSFFFCFISSIFFSTPSSSSPSSPSPSSA